jgi:hypothetical protein
MSRSDEVRAAQRAGGGDTGFDKEKLLEVLKQTLGLAEDGLCPHCKEPMVKQKQIGRCVFADPCGCRLYQGKVSKKK